MFRVLLYSRQWRRRAAGAEARVRVRVRVRDRDRVRVRLNISCLAILTTVANASSWGCGLTNDARNPSASRGLSREGTHWIRRVEHLPQQGIVGGGAAARGIHRIHYGFGLPNEERDTSASRGRPQGFIGFIRFIGVHRIHSVEHLSQGFVGFIGVQMIYRVKHLSQEGFTGCIGVHRGS